MPIAEFFTRLTGGLLSLGAKRLVTLAVVGLLSFSIIAVGGYFLNRPARDVLYSGLDPSDVARIGAALDDAGIAFDVNVAGDTVLVDYGKTAQARTILAELGLPKSDRAGYELFDQLGSLGLTSFMQQITKVRALEGELARTIQLIDGVRAARVHLAMKSENGFRAAKEQASASVVIRTDGRIANASANAIRHLVAAAIPGLPAEHVTIMSTDGELLASTDDPTSAAPEKLMGLERTAAAEVEAKVARALAPYLGPDNFRISASVKLNADQRQINETTFDPNSRVERSTRTIKESGEAENANSSEPVSVDQNVPQAEESKPAGDSSREKKDRREELTNYEINSKSVSTSSNGYAVDRLSLAIVVDRKQLTAPEGQTANGTLETQLAEIEQLARSAAGLEETRGDQIKITAVDFKVDEMSPESVPEGIAATTFFNNLGTIINALAFVLVTALVLALGLKPALRMVLEAPPPALGKPSAGMPSLNALEGGLSGNEMPSMAMASMNDFEADSMLRDIRKEVSNNPRDRLSKIVELDPDRAVEVMKNWMHQPADMRS